MGREAEEIKEEKVRDLEAQEYCDHKTALKVTLGDCLHNLTACLQRKGIYYEKDVFITNHMLNSCIDSYMQLSKNGDNHEQ